MQTKKLQKIHTQKKKQPKLNSKDSHQTTREKNKKRRKKQQRSEKINKMPIRT